MQVLSLPIFTPLTRLSDQQFSNILMPEVNDDYRLWPDENINDFQKSPIYMELIAETVKHIYSSNHQTWKQVKAKFVAERMNNG